MLQLAIFSDAFTSAITSAAAAESGAAVSMVLQLLPLLLLPLSLLLLCCYYPNHCRCFASAASASAVLLLHTLERELAAFNDITEFRRNELAKHQINVGDAYWAQWTRLYL